MKWYAAKIRELTFEEMDKSLIDVPNAYEICEVPEGVQAHKMKPFPIGWGYFDTENEARKAVKADRFPSYK